MAHGWLDYVHTQYTCNVLNRGNNMVEKLPFFFFFFAKLVEKLPAIRKLLLDNNNLVTVPATWNEKLLLDNNNLLTVLATWNEKLFNGRIITSFPSIKK